MAKLKENSYKVFEYVKAHEAENITAKDISLFIDRLVLDTTYFLREDYNE